MTDAMPPECKIKELKHWIVYVHPNQTYLGRGAFVLKREATKDTMTPEEMDELARAQEAYLGLVKKDFKPDAVDEQWGVSGGNLLFEFIPRYRSFRIQNGAEFNDPNFGSPFQNTEWTIERAAKAFVIKMLVMRFRQPFLTVG